MELASEARASEPVELIPAPSPPVIDLRVSRSTSRREEIYHLAVTSGLASVEELYTPFEVTASTIRRDLALHGGRRL
ncbi:DeoR family transcriptional regulator [Arthrobacter sp. SLBN-112]|uniref:DeoR family transcriptional regulator n=1 Tax=Arthrobacter sp. SLBN-112 TaxID=2768452 RepID=UPI0035A975DC